jgi:hypothetical protein
MLQKYTKTAGDFIFKFSEKNERLKFLNTPRQYHQLLKVIQYDLLMNKIKEFDNQTDASNALNIASGSINRCCLANNTRQDNFIFKFSNITEEAVSLL